ncbi:hypothetical protein QZH41_013139, partial [Actinostola sp. cb2023]
TSFFIDLIATIPCKSVDTSLGQRTGVTMRRYDFSDPQAGKDVCDRRIAVLKSHIRRYVNEGYNVHTAADMKTAMDSYGGVK